MPQKLPGAAPLPVALPAAAPVPAPAAAPVTEKLLQLNLRDAPLDQVLDLYGELTGRTLIRAPGLTATITLRAQGRLTPAEALQAIDAVLAANNIAVVPQGEKFLKVIQIGTARQEGMPLGRTALTQPLPETDKLVSQVVTLKHLELAEVQPILTGLLHSYGKAQPLERTNSLLLTDTSANLQRILELLEYLDRPSELKIETRFYTLKYAEAVKVAARLTEVIADSQGKDDKARTAGAFTGAAATPTPVTPPGLIRPPVVHTEGGGGSAEVEAALAARGVVQGKVKIVADERTNLLIVIGRESNFAFFDKLIEMLDRAVEPETTNVVLPLQFAKAEEIAVILNDFIGAGRTGSSAATAGSTSQRSTSGRVLNSAASARSQMLQQYLDQQRAAAQAAASAARPGGVQVEPRSGQIAPTTRILADKRTNSLLLMGTREDLATLTALINQLDRMLAQVLIEAVILEVSLTKKLETGVDWLQRSMTVYNERHAGPGGGTTVRQPAYSFGGAQRVESSANRSGFIDASAGLARNSVMQPTLNYYATFFDLNMDVVIRMLASQSDARIVDTPVIMTVDNVKGKINVGEQRPVVTSTSLSTIGGQQVSNYEYKNIGITLEVTPRINPNSVVEMEVNQTADNVGELVRVDNNEVPVITKREWTAKIIAKSRSTVVLGGLVSTAVHKGRSKVPVLGDIPFLGVLFRSDSHENDRTELMVLMTPYVLQTPEEALAETARINAHTEASKSWTRGWSDSPLAPLPEGAVTNKASAAATNAPAAPTKAPAAVPNVPAALNPVATVPLR